MVVFAPLEFLSGVYLTTWIVGAVLPFFSQLEMKLIFVYLELTKDLLERRDEEEQIISDFPVVRHIQYGLGALRKKLEDIFGRFCAIHDGIRTTVIAVPLISQ